jgi:S-formylglutathione hydrolase FrmB
VSEYTVNLKSRILAGPTDLTFLLPGPQSGVDARQFYQSGQKYKVLWMLHAGMGDHHDWLRNTSIGRLVEDRKVIVVMPSGLNSDFANHPGFADGYNFSDFFFDELMPFVHNWFPASDRAEDNFIAGFSMGAAATWMYGLLQPDRFGGLAPIGSPPISYTFLEPYRSMERGEFVARATADNKAFATAYGNPAGGIKPKEINKISKYASVGDFLDSSEHTWDRFREAVAAGKVPRTYLPCGTEDLMYPKVLRFKEYADELGAEGITYEFVKGAGGGFGFCDSILPRMLDFFAID